MFLKTVFRLSCRAASPSANLPYTNSSKTAFNSSRKEFCSSFASDIKAEPFKVTSFPGMGIEDILDLTCPKVSLDKDKANRRIHCFQMLLIFSYGTFGNGSVDMLFTPSAP